MRLENNPEQKSLTHGDITQQETQNLNKASMKLQTESFTAEKKAVAAQQQRHTVTSAGVFNKEKHSAQSAQSNIKFTTKGMTKSLMTSASQMSHMVNGTTTSTKMITSSASSSGISAAQIDEILNLDFDDLEKLSKNSLVSQQNIDAIIAKYTGCLENIVQVMQNFSSDQEKRAPAVLDKVNDLMQKAWAVPTHGHEIGYSLCNTLRNCGGMDLLISNCVEKDLDLQFSSARLLEQCLTTENRDHVVENGLDKVVRVACVCTKNINSVEHSRVGTGILEHLFKHSEGTCSDVIGLGGLDTVLFECRKNDIETLRHCAGALANLSLYGGAENQEAMIKRKVPVWLFPLAFHNDDNIKYYACLAIAVLVANTEIEAAVLKSGTLDLVEPFVMSHSPSEFAKSNLAHAHGQNRNWLQKLVPVLSSKREEARNLAAFHFCMEAGIKKQQGKTDIFKEIGAIEPLKKVASCPNAVASKYAAQTLRLIGETVPHKLSQQVPLWSTEDVREWVRQIGFAEYANNFVESRVDGDLLLQLNEEHLRDDIGIHNGIQRRRFERELQNLKKMADYSSKDVTNLNNFLLNLGQEFSIYTYSMLNAGVDKDSIKALSEEQLICECGIHNSIHRLRIMEAIHEIEREWNKEYEDNPDKNLDVFISYRRSNGSQLASLLKVHLELRQFKVFIDVERLEAGKFDNNLLQSIKQARNFLLVLTPKALDRCMEDNESECKDWVHREIVAALQSGCNIIPILDNFAWPDPEQLPADMRAICKFNGVRWIHDYQDACVDKLERFMRGELNSYRSALSVKSDPPSTPNILNKVNAPTYQRMHSNDSSKGSNGDTSSRPD
ncbi:sterile alpha and TIR motif-containing protein 1 isoform X1 [Diaphorina citri]|uniref:ADP-ribosyl cyclase/cyclic ADP-ribose hydrolase n=3 Tax=Diaphorina citri TaxID=121845 RepID=A0A3Q0INP0_DIACI|nr:sterile alpha and TIR motif-containing protein 1 isoform X1 [Diaphorina citri]